MMIVLQVVLAIFILVGGFIKLFRIPFQIEHWQHYQYPLWFMSIIGFIEIVGAIGIIGGIWNPYLALGSNILLVVLMVGAIHAHIFRAHQSILMIIPATLCLILSTTIIIWNLNVFS
ncbi:DoxX family protein [Bacillus sp. Xin]|uniref:DoxX family protein n=1 Tax=unclassified Bacillus (in: firmicutes) TaxID=185979 RepID=UPI001571B52E|nr:MULTISPECIES: DoxX family protein [unclassified Bacillus (in: firmicutes)]MBC6972427.1 DoxX family protein [Bacillus sp. Xin]NSW39515.1 DoxX family protein [Bacillus sp. Xin1]